MTIAPSADGYFGAWLAAELPPGVSGQAVVVESSPSSPPGSNGYRPLWRPVGNAEWALDLVGALRLGQRTYARVALGGILELANALDGFLLVGTEGKAAVFIDGKSVFRRSHETHLLSWDAVPVALPPGKHGLVIELEKSGDRWTFGARLLDGADLMPPDTAVLRLPGLAANAGERLLESMIATTIRMHASPTGVRPSVAVRVPRGVPLVSDRRLAVRLLESTGPARLFNLGALPVGPRGASDVESMLPPIGLPSIAASVRAEFTMSATRRTTTFRLDPRVPELLNRAELVRARLRKDAKTDPDIVLTTLESRIRAVSEIHADEPTSSENVRSLESFVEILERGGDPLREQKGVTAWVHRSRLDGSPHAFLLHVPESYRPGTSNSYPLVVVLHGFRGTPDGVLRAFLGRDSHDPRPRVDGFVLAPEAFGDAFYKGPGEAEVMDLLRWVEATFPIDRRRVSITGVSMGGTGAAQIAFRHSEEFAATAPLAGYHSYFIRRDTTGKQLRPWEEPLMHHFSPVSWAENGRHLLLFVAHGTRDHPLENSRVLTRRYGQLGYDLVSEWPATGHAVWKVAYSGARLWPVLTARRAPEMPPRVTLVTDRLRYGHAYWVGIEEIDPPGAMARIDAQVVGQRHVTISTSHVRAVSVARPMPHVEPSGTVTVTIDGANVDVTDGGPLRLTKEPDGWRRRTEAVAGTRKRVDVEGAIGDAYLEPLIFVYGSLDPKSMRANREVAEYFATVYTGSSAYPIMADVEFDPRLAETHSLFLVGAAGSNALLSSIEARLPIVADRAGIIAGRQRYEGEEAGAMFVFPHPDHPTRVVVLVTAPDCRGIWRARSLPRLLPDFVIYDQRVAPASGEQVLGDASVRAAGFFNRDWTLPPSP